MGRRGAFADFIYFTDGFHGKTSKIDLLGIIAKLFGNYNEPEEIILPGAALPGLILLPA
jgi:hypothetical protein